MTTMLRATVRSEKTLREMHVNITRLGRHFWSIARLGLTVAVVLLTVLPLAAGDKSDKSNEPDPVQPANASQYAGSDTCKGCHEDQFKNIDLTRHHQINALKTAAVGGQPDRVCEACHGPGRAHVDGGGDKTKIFRFAGAKREETSARCLTCHGEGRGQTHFAESAHASSDVGCLDCHSPHHAQEKDHLLAQKQPQLCYGCHTAAKADFAKPYHHRVNEGLVRCNDCHNPHGTATVRQVQTLASGDAVCYKCHVDKQGPFVYEHVPVKAEGCSSCHSPHGSTNPRLLKVSLVNMLCLQCHTFPMSGPIGPVHNQSAKYQACTMCHSQIHGSNFSFVFFK